MDRWLCTDFEQQEDDDVIEVKRAKRSSRAGTNSRPCKKLSTAISRHRGEDSDLWVNKYSPKTQTAVAGNKKKVQDLYLWLQTSLSSLKCQQRQSTDNIILLTGPSGCGKTASVRAICNDVQAQIQEWSSPTAEFIPLEARGDNSLPYVSQSKMFDNFLLRANKYASLPGLASQEDASPNRVVLVEDIPNIYLRQHAEWHNILRKYHKSARSPLVIIYNTAGEASEKALFPESLQSELKVKHITYNPVPRTDMRKVLQQIATNERTLDISKSFIDNLSDSCGGDIRAAINTLEFTFDSQSQISATVSKSVAKRRKGSKSSTQSTEDLAQKDETMILFRALGKVLYCKREETQSSCEENLPVHLKHHMRRNMAFNPEQVFEQSRVSSHFYTLCLHQNYPQFMPNLQNTQRASEYLVTSDLLADKFSSRHVTGKAEVDLSMAARGLMHSNSQITTTKLGWLPLRKPEWFNAVKQTRQNAESARRLSHTTVATDILYSELVPYYSLLGKRDPLSSVIPPFKQFSTRFGQSERLDEKDTRVEGYEDDSSSYEQAFWLPQAPTLEPDNEDGFIIESV